jgi:hypothetical protein
MNVRRGLLVLWLTVIATTLPAQLNTGVIEGTLRDTRGSPVAGETILITDGTGFRGVIRTGSKGDFSTTLPYGWYRLSYEDAHPSDAIVFVAPLQTLRVDLVMNGEGSIRAQAGRSAGTPDTWSDDTGGRRYPEPFSLTGLLLSREPASITQPLDFSGLGDNRLAVVSQRGFSWTGTQSRLQGMNAADSWQPGFPAILPDVEALDDVVVRSGFAGTAASGDGIEIGLFLAAPRTSWHGSLSTAGTGAALSSANLPALAGRGLVRQPDRFDWFTRDRFDLGGQFKQRVDFYASGSGQWASQTEPLASRGASPGSSERSRLLFGNARGRVRATSADRFDALYSGSRIDRSDGVPAGLEALTGNRMAPSFVLPGGFPGQPETDHLDFAQVGWTHISPAESRWGLIELRYGYAATHLDTYIPPLGTSRVELLGGTVSGAPPLGNLAVRQRHEVEAAWQPATLRVGGTHHRISAGGGWERSEPNNRFTVPSDRNLITANGVPAFVTEFNTPVDSRELVRSVSAWIADHIVTARSLSFDFGARADFSRGSIPAQSSAPGTYAPARTFAVQPDRIVWNSVSPRAGFAWQVPHARGLVLRGAYSRLYAPLAGRLLDFGNPNSLGGSVYQWIASDPGSPFGPAELGRLLLRFGGPYSSISPTLRRPDSDEFDVGAEFRPARSSVARVELFRRDEKNRIAAIDTGVGPQAFTPVSIQDPGPDGIPGTFDDQTLTVYAQNPATFGQDRYLLTNPAGLRMLNTGILAEVGTGWRGLTLHASFVAEKSYGPTNPGDAFYENDPGVIGALFLDPNTTVHAAGRIFVDRAYAGKVQAAYRLPAAWGRIELASVAVYTDGLVFARRLLVTGLPQGPFLVATTVRGSPEGGNRAQYAINWNLRIGREFGLPIGRLAVFGDILNVTNAGQSLQQNDLSGPSFNLRLPVLIQPPRMVRLGFRYSF